MDGAFILILLSVVMLIGSILAGNIPLVVQLSEDMLKRVTIFGAGLLVGTALTVIIPEGIRAIYANCVAHAHEEEHHSHASDSNLTKVPHSSASEGQQETIIGLTLILGFIFMMIVDQITHSFHGHQNNSGPTNDAARSRAKFFFFKGCLNVKRFFGGFMRKMFGDEELESSSGGLTATIGLVVHAAADGVALGAAATTQHSDVEMIVFLAIMLHKAPAAFGLVSFLLHEGVPRKQIRKNLLLFAAAAPLMALVTFFFLGNEQKAKLDTVNGTGMAMLFSAGTFLYVATVHVLPELSLRKRKVALKSGQSAVCEKEEKKPLLSDDDDDEQRESNQDSVINMNNDNDKTGGGGEEFLIITEQQFFKNSELLLLITGALMPCLLTLGGHHH